MTFEAKGRSLLANGYLIIPIQPGHKRPSIAEWQSARLGATDLGRYHSHGCGVLTGQGANPIAAFDVDTTNEALAQRFVQWCRDTLGVTCERVGKAPKVLLPYRAEVEGLSKATGAWFEGDGVRHRLEVLGKGQQFVAYHIHPDTGQPYEWIDLLGGIEYIPAIDLPVVSAAQIETALMVFDQMAEEAGLTRVAGSVSRAGLVTSSIDDDPLMRYEPTVGISLGEAKRLMSYVDNEDYQTWLKVGMSLHHEFDGSDEAMTLWDEWSSSAGNYSSSDDIAYRWQSFGRHGSSPTTARWLLKVSGEGKREERREQVTEVKALIADCTDSIDLINVVAKRAGEAAGGDLGVRAELAGLIRRQFKEITGEQLPIADCRAAMSTREVTVRQKRPLTEFGNAMRMLDRYGEGLMYVPEIEAWYIWTSVYWRRAAAVELEHLAKQTILALPDEAKDLEGDDLGAFYKFCAISQKAVMVSNMVKLAQSDPRVVVSVEDLDRDNYLMGVQNGVVNLRTGELLAPDQSYRITTVAGVDYVRGAACPLWKKVVADAQFDNQEMVSFIQRVIGYSFLGNPVESVLVIPYGSGSNGKSKIFGAVREVLGGYAKAASQETFLSSGMGNNNAGGPREDLVRLRGARMVYVGEPEEGSELREGLVKSMTGGDPIPARGIHGKTTIELIPTWVPVMPTNHRPIIKGDDIAIWRRLMPIPFQRNYENDPTIEKDPDLAYKLKAEYEGIFAWCVQGAIDYLRVGFKRPKAVQDAREEYKNDMDLLGDWLDECCEFAGGASESCTALFLSWKSFSERRGEFRYISSQARFTRRMTQRGLDKGKVKGQQALFGIRLKCEFDFV